ncbi:MAG: hypothetical protein ABSF83_15250, partial [Nitrososphaerales archaeon]
MVSVHVWVRPPAGSRAHRGVWRRAPRGRTADLLLLAALVVLCTLWLISPFPDASAAGGSRAQTGAFAQPAWFTYTGLFDTTTPITSVIQNDYSVVLVAVSGTAQSVTSITDTAGTSYSKTVGSASNQDTEIWCGQYTAASGSVSVTVHLSGSATFAFTVYVLSGLSGCAGAVTEAAHGSTGAMSVASFTPATGDACIVLGNELAGLSQPNYGQANPFLSDSNGGSGYPNMVGVVAGSQYAVATLRGAWSANDGATT